MGTNLETFARQKREPQTVISWLHRFWRKIEGMKELCRGSQSWYFSCSTKHAQERGARWHHQPQLWSRIRQGMSILLPIVIWISYAQAISSCCPSSPASASSSMTALLPCQARYSSTGVSREWCALPTNDMDSSPDGKKYSLFQRRKRRGLERPPKVT